jgi:tetratricopeptide (TPR) repeat protein
LESDGLELRLQALRDTDGLVDLCTKLLRRHTGRNTEDRFLLTAAGLIRKHVSSSAARSWLEATCNPQSLLGAGRGRTAALYLQLLRETGKLEEARLQAKAFMGDMKANGAHESVWEECILTLRGLPQGGTSDLQECVNSLAARIPPPRRLRLWSIAARNRVLVASAATTAVSGGSTDSLAPLRLALGVQQSLASLYLRQQNYTAAASSLQQAHDLSVQIQGGETVRSLEFSLQEFEMLLRAQQVQPSDLNWLGTLRSVAAQLNQSAYLEHRLANVMRKAGYQQLALNQYAYVVSLYPQDPYGIRSAYHLAVDSEDSGALGDAQTQYMAIAANPAAQLSVVSLCLIGAYRCAVRQNNQALQSQVIQSLQSLNTSGSSLRTVLMIVRQLRDDRLGGLADILLDQALQQYQSVASGSSSYLYVRHLLVRRLHQAKRFSDAVAVVNAIDASYWNNPNIGWYHLAGCLHHACLSWLALDNQNNGTTLPAGAVTALQSRPSQNAHVTLAIAESYEKTGGWAAASNLYTQIVSMAPFSAAAMKAKLRLARRAWQTGQIDNACQLAAGVLYDGKRGRKDPDLGAAFWSAYGMAASQAGTTGGPNGVYPVVSAKEAMKRERATRIRRIFHLS